MTQEQAGVRFTLLGPLRLISQDGTALPAGPPKQQAMLAALALSPGRALSIARLTDALWGTHMPASGVSTIRTYAWRIRQLLARAGAGGGVLVSVGDGYRLAVAPSVVDALHAEELAAAARRHLAAGEPRQARQALADALVMWAGEPLAGVPGPFAERARDGLTELHTAVTEQHFEAELQLGHYQQALPRLTEVIAEHPLRERPYVLLMRALYGMGRQVEALQVFHDARRLLVEAHGVEPGVELTQVHERILRGDSAVAPPPARAEHPVPAASPTVPEQSGPRPPVPAQLPPDLPDFTGRTAQYAQLEAVLTAPDRSSPAIVAITGMSGVGKTSLAVHLAHRVREQYPDGQVHVDLGDPDGKGEPLSGADLLGLLLASLGVPADRTPGSLAERRGLLRSVLDGRRVLILLDNVSQAAQIRDSLPGTPGCAVLITSRTRLDGLPLHAQLALEVFEPQEALDLLQRGIGTQRLAAERSDALALVAACGRLPLAIRIVASRLAARPRWTLRSVAERLEDERRRIAELRSGPLAVEAVFQVGYRQLAAQQSNDFVLLATVAGAEFALSEAAAVLDLDPADAELRLEALVDAAMLDEPIPGRFRYHQLLRSFALSREHDRAQERAALGRLLVSLLATARNAFALAVPGDPTGDALGTGLSDVPGIMMSDLRSARAWAASSADTVVAVCAHVVELGTAPLLRIAVDLLIAMSPFADELRSNRLAATARKLADAVARIPEPATDRRGYQRVVGRAEFLCSTVALHTSRPDEVERHARRAVAAASAGKDPVILRQALNDLGLVAQLRHDYRLASACFHQAVELARELGHRSGEVASSLNAALAGLRAGDPDTAVATCESALAVARGMNDAPGTGFALYVLGLAHHAQGLYEAAVERFTACVEHCLTAGIRDREAHARFRLADTLLALGRHEDALAQAGQALLRCEELGVARDQAHALMVLGRALAASGRTAEAVERLTRARGLYVALGLPEAEEAARLAETVSQPPLRLVTENPGAA
ncbi:BTAD domain-containing putative transcriptional regulator [Streptomyces sp. NPDC056161]|uniref:AfsR/SARP family transcriptional regulator n=1 Tax=Streptomyces sp. NPDC056161 TaxID=3345732 RepID=UPI0035D65AA9